MTTPERKPPIRRIAYFLMAVAVAVFTPSPDALTMMYFLLPSIILFELVYFVYRRWS